MQQSAWTVLLWTADIKENTRRQIQIVKQKSVTDALLAYTHVTAAIRECSLSIYDL